MNNSYMPAMPINDKVCVGKDEYGIGIFRNAYGLTKREDFIKAAMQGLCAREGWPLEQIAEDAVIIAELVLKELEK